ncbi:protein of unknown function [Pseudomonas sp. JV551A1]|uniref:Uncharacterized protein n=1 Tax=Pseudomonas inefficax TaxID=2078786 RepID=A0AAQ1P6D0_9PSED|nr:protein of unknown function [Pseudomonas sp. JV551A1]SPO60607.1 protein of unknown function [Pseudomonas inefficax]
MLSKRVRRERLRPAVTVLGPGQGRVRLKDDLVDGVFQAFAGLETWNLGGFDLDRLAGLRVAAGALCALLDREGTEANQYHIVTLLQGAGDGFDDCVQRTAGYSFRDVSRCGDSVNQFRLVHSKSPYSLLSLFLSM